MRMMHRRDGLLQKYDFFVRRWAEVGQFLREEGVFVPDFRPSAGKSCGVFHKPFVCDAIRPRKRLASEKKIVFLLRTCCAYLSCTNSNDSTLLF